MYVYVYVYLAACQLYNVACIAVWVSEAHSLSIFALVKLRCRPLGGTKIA